MAGRGPAPKDPRRRARTNSDAGHAVRVIVAEPTAQPDLPEGIPWPPATRAWWQMWRESPLTEDFTATDWSFLQDTAILHAQLWGNGDVSVLPELRLRVAKFGATPEDRARLRIQFAAAEDAEDKTTRRVASRARGARAKLKAI